MVSGPIRNVAVVGTGTLGTQIAAQAAYYGCKVSGYDSDETSFTRAVERIGVRIDNSGRAPALSFEQVKEGAAKVRLSSDLAAVLEGADLVIEAVPEDLGLKRKVFAEMDRLAPPGAVLATNSSSIPVSRIEDATGRPEKCVNIHFYSLDLGRNMADVMGGSKTSDRVMKACIQWVWDIRCVPLTVKKETIGFCFNRIWRSIKREALHMWADGYVDFRDIDKGWMIWAGMAQGPFGFMDGVGLDVVYGIEMVYYDASKEDRDRPPDALKAMLDRNELGVKTGKGFYSYPNPEYRDPDFLKR
jgi:3-hydroxyacyl-CoA dehydrogenase